MSEIDAAASGDAPSRLFRRRQFLLGPMLTQRPVGWRTLPIAGGRMTLLAHPDLAVSQASHGSLELTLIGGLLDPDHPDRHDADVLAAALPAAHDDASLQEELRRMGGRWALVVARDRSLSLVHDPCGLRQVLHATREDGVWCASEAGLLAEELSLERDPAASAFMTSIYPRSYPEWYFPADSSPFIGMAHLLPNHRLDLVAGTVARHWPSARRGSMSLEEGAQKSALLLKGVVTAAARRGPLALALTGGIDSRTVLAASRDVAPDLLGYTLVGPTVSSGERDAATAERVLARVGLAHQVIDCSTEPDAAFDALYRTSVFLGHDAWRPIAAALVRSYPQERVSMTGSCSELGRRGYRRFRGIGPATLARFDNFAWDPFARQAVDRWFADLGDVEPRHGYHPSDIWYQENRIAKWLAGGLLEFDIAQETLAPFNCRALIETMQSLATADRDPPRNRLHHRLIEILWPDLLLEPINPMPRSTALYEDWKMAFWRHLARSPAFDPIKGTYLRLKLRARR